MSDLFRHHYYYPRAVVGMTVTAVTNLRTGNYDTANFVVTPRSVTWVRNNFNEADELQIEFDTQSFPILPRNIRQILLEVYAGDVKGLGRTFSDLPNARDFVRFIGYADDPEMTLSEDEGKIHMKARDFTSLFLDRKRPTEKIVPSFSDRLDTALLRIRDEIPNGDALELELLGLDAWPYLSEGAPKNMAKAKVPYKAEDSLWDLVKRACDPLGLIPQIRLDKLVVAPVQGLSTALSESPPLLAYGQNLLNFREKKNLKRLREGIGLRAYDASSHTYITALYPPEGDRSIVKRLPAPGAAAKKKKAPPPPLVAGTNDKRHWFSYKSVSSKKELEIAAQDIFEKRQFQEFEASFNIVRMRIQTRDDLSFFDTTKLESGDSLYLDIDPDSRALLEGFTDRADRVDALINRGYEPQMAILCVKIFEGGTAGPVQMYVNKATHKIDENGYTCDVDVQNKLG